MTQSRPLALADIEDLAPLRGELALQAQLFKAEVRTLRQDAENTRTSGSACSRTCARRATPSTATACRSAPRRSCWPRRCAAAAATAKALKH